MRAHLAVVMVVALVTAACGSSEAEQPQRYSDFCEQAEPGPESEGVHVPAGTPIDYLSSPPTGGDHYADPGPKPGVYEQPLSEPHQVAALEVGYVVVNYDPDQLDDREVAQLAGVADSNFGVLLTPQAAPMDGGAAVGVTAQGRIQLCDRADPAAVDSFAADHLRPN